MRHRGNRCTFSLSGVVLSSSPASGSSDAVIVPVSSSFNLDSHRTLFFDPPSSSDTVAVAVDNDLFDALFLIAWIRIRWGKGRNEGNLREGARDVTSRGGQSRREERGEKLRLSIEMSGAKRHELMPYTEVYFLPTFSKSFASSPATVSGGETHELEWNGKP